MNAPNSAKRASEASPVAASVVVEGLSPSFVPGVLGVLDTPSSLPSFTSLYTTAYAENLSVSKVSSCVFVSNAAGSTSALPS